MLTLQKETLQRDRKQEKKHERARCGDTLTCKQKPSTTVSKSRQTVQSFPDKVAGLSTSKFVSPEISRPGCNCRNSKRDFPTVDYSKCHHIAPSRASFVPSQNLAHLPPPPPTPKKKRMGFVVCPSACCAKAGNRLRTDTHRRT